MSDRTDESCTGQPAIPGGYDGGHPATDLFSLLGRSHAMVKVLFYVI